jgi:hypothetical protein
LVDFDCEPDAVVVGGPAGRVFAADVAADDVVADEVLLVGVPVVGGVAGAFVVVPLAGEAAAPDAGGALAGAASFEFAGAPPEEPGSISEIICWNVASSMGRSDFPSQVEPSGRWF